MYREIIASSQKSRASVDAMHGLNPLDFKWAFPNTSLGRYTATEIGVLMGLNEKVFEGEDNNDF